MGVGVLTYIGLGFMFAGLAGVGFAATRWRLQRGRRLPVRPMRLQEWYESRYAAHAGDYPARPAEAVSVVDGDPPTEVWRGPDAHWMTHDDESFLVALLQGAGCRDEWDTVPLGVQRR